jgi:SAM-dependent methyltransferase
MSDYLSHLASHTSFGAALCDGAKSTDSRAEHRIAYPDLQLREQRSVRELDDYSQHDPAGLAAQAQINAVEAKALQAMGCDVLGVDLSADNFEATTRHVVMDLNSPDFASVLGVSGFDLVTAVEVIEHVESPVGFLRNVGRLLASEGLAILTTPNVDSLPARLRHLFTGKIRLMDENSEPSHISPIFYDLFRRQFLPQSSLSLVNHQLFPPGGFNHSRKPVSWAMRFTSHFFRDESITGDHHVLVLKSAPLE